MPSLWHFCSAAARAFSSRPDDVVKTVQECVDKKGKLDENKALIPRW